MQKPLFIDVENILFVGKEILHKHFRLEIYYLSGGSDERCMLSVLFG